MRILLVNSLYYPDFVGGAERSVQVLAEDLAGPGARRRRRLHNEPRVGRDRGGRRRPGPSPHTSQSLLGLDERRHSPIERLLWHARDNDNGPMAEKFLQGRALRAARRDPHEQPRGFLHRDLGGSPSPAYSHRAYPARLLPHVPTLHDVRSRLLLRPSLPGLPPVRHAEGARRRGACPPWWGSAVRSSRSTWPTATSLAPTRR